MRDWVFLIQREGERNWQPIQTATLEIEEYRYRIIGQADVANLCVEVRIDAKPLNGSTMLSPCRQTYSRRTDDQGLIVILPYTYLSAGLWEFSCCCDAMSELMGEIWRTCLKIFSVPKGEDLALLEAYSIPYPEVTQLAQSIPTHQILHSPSKVLPPKLNLSPQKVRKKSPQLPKFPS